MASRPSSPPESRRVLLPCLVALAAHLVLLALLPARWRANQSSDFDTFYRPVALNLIEGRGLVDGAGRPALRYPAGFPLILAGVLSLSRSTGLPESLALRLIAAASVVVTTALVWHLARTCFDSRTALLAGLAWGTYPFHLWLAKQPNSELPFLVLLLAALAVFLVGLLSGNGLGGRAFVAGALLGLASLVRPSAILVAVPLALALAWLRKALSARARLTAIALLIAGNALVLVPWEAWAHARTGVWIPLSTGGLPSAIDGLTYAAKPGAEGHFAATPEGPRRLMAEILERRREFRSPGDLAAFLLERVRAEPGAVFGLMLLKAARAWYGTEAQWLERFIAAIQLPYLVLAGIGLTVALRSGPRGRAFVLTALLLLVYFWVMTVAVLSILRYMVPVMALLMVLAGHALARSCLSAAP